MQKQLNKFRKKIDAIDERLIDLLAKRSEVIAEVKNLKKDIYPKIRIARETLQAYKIQKSNFGFYKHETMQKVWREFIFASLCIEGDLNIEVLNNSEDVNSITPLWVLTRDHFGTYSNVSTTDSLAKIFDNLERNITTLAVIPFPDHNEELIELLKDHTDIKICLFLPFLPVPSNIKSETGLVIGKAKIEESEQDVSLFLIQHADIKPMPNIKILFSKNGMHLASINGFTQDRGLISNLTNAPVSNIFYLGSYPKPISL